MTNKLNFLVPHCPETLAVEHSAYTDVLKENEEYRKAIKIMADYVKKMNAPFIVSVDDHFDDAIAVVPYKEFLALTAAVIEMETTGKFEGKLGVKDLKEILENDEN